MKLRILSVIAIMALILFGVLSRDALTDWLAARLWPALEEPVPTVTLERKPYQVKVIADGTLTGFQTTPVVAPRVRGSLKVAWLIEEGAIVKPGDLLIRFDNTDAQLALEKNETSVSSFQHRIQKTGADRQTELRSLHKDHEAAELELAFARNQIRRDETIFSLWEIQESVVSAALAEYRRGNIDQKAAIRETLSEADLKILGIEKDKAQSEVDQAKNTLSSLEVRAPAAGVVLDKSRGFRKLELGREVWPGQPLLEIAALNQYQGNLQVVETNIGGVESGNFVEFTLSAFPETRFKGSVLQVEGVPQQIARQDPRKYFGCKVNLDVPLEILEQLKPGMSLRGEILISSKEAAFVVPKSAVFKQENEFFVFIKEGESYQKKPVRILEGDHGFYIVDGVEEKAQLCLRHPFEKESLHLPDFNAPTGAAQSRRFVVFFD